MYKFLGEAKLDVVADIADPLFEILADPDILKVLNSGASTNKIVPIALKKYRKQVVEILARLQTEDGVSPKEYLDQVGLLAIPIEFSQFLASPEYNAVFNVQGQSTDKTSSGSATENTEVKGR